jgi:hypothetical protein
MICNVKSARRPKNQKTQQHSIYARETYTVLNQKTQEIFGNRGVTLPTTTSYNTVQISYISLSEVAKRTLLYLAYFEGDFIENGLNLEPVILAIPETLFVIIGEELQNNKHGFGAMREWALGGLTKVSSTIHHSTDMFCDQTEYRRIAESMNHPAPETHNTQMGAREYLRRDREDKERTETNHGDTKRDHQSANADDTTKDTKEDQIKGLDAAAIMEILGNTNPNALRELKTLLASPNEQSKKRRRVSFPSSVTNKEEEEPVANSTRSRTGTPTINVTD